VVLKTNNPCKVVLQEEEKMKKEEEEGEKDE